jgi:hypothetical protein
VNYVFRSASHEGETLAVICHNACGTEEFETTISLPQCTPFSIDDFIIDSEQALEIGLENGGTNYIGSSSSIIKLTLGRGFPGCNSSAVTWEVNFRNVATFNGINISLDAITGEVLEIRK